MNIVLDVSILIKALIHQDKDSDLHCRNIWDYVNQFDFFHVCFDENRKIDEVYENALCESTEYRKWYTEQLPRRYAHRQPHRFDGTCITKKEDSLSDYYYVLLSVAKNSNGCETILDHNELLYEEARLNSISFLNAPDAHNMLKSSWRMWLLTSIQDSFDLNELQELCFDLSLEYDNLEGNTLGIKTLALIRYFEHRGQCDILLSRCKEKRPQKFVFPH